MTNYQRQLIFGINMQRKFSLSYTWDKERNCYIQREGKFLVYTNTCGQKATIGTVRSMLRIPPWHNGVVPIKISGTIIEESMVFFITDDNTSKGKHLNINIISSIHKIKGRTSVNILVSNHTNKYLTFHKGEYIRHLEPAVIDDNTIEQMETQQTNSVTLKKSWQRQSHLSTMPWIIQYYPTWTQYPTEAIWIPICKGQNLSWNYTSHQHDDRHRSFWPCLSETLPHCHKALSMGERGNRKTTHSQGHPQ